MVRCRGARSGGIARGRRGPGAHAHRRHRQRRHVDVGGRLARRPHARHRSAGQHLDDAGRRRRGDAHHRLFNDARQPTWSPDGKWITFFAYRDGGYDIWAVAPDGSQQHKLTWGPFDDREPVWSHDGTRVAFSSDRGNPLGSDYNIWMLDVRTGEFRQLTKAPADDYMPTWSPDDREIAFASARDDGQSVWAVNVADGTERKVSTAAGRVDAPSWGPGGQIVYHVTAPGQSRFEIDGQTLTGAENVFAFRASWASPTEFFYVSDGKIRRRSADAQQPADDRLHRDDAGDARGDGLHAPQARLHVDGAAPGRSASSGR